MKIKNLFLPFAFLAMVFLLSLTSCRDKVYEEITYVANVPVYMEFSEFRNAVVGSEARPLIQPGKIYFKDDFLYINESQEGVHIVDNSNPASPQMIGFIEIPGCADIAIKGNILYADSFIDLVAIDISNPNNPVEVDRIENAFPNVLPILDLMLPVYGLDFEKGVVVGWDTREVTEVVERGGHLRRNFVKFDVAASPSLGAAEVSIAQHVGIGGSMARFTLHGDYMYAVYNTELKVFNIGQTPGMSYDKEIPLNRIVETIFPYDEKLFLGTTTGMLVYGLSNPSVPDYISAFDHISSCDPVVVEGDLAYVTLRSGTHCDGFTNQLDVFDISDITNPQLVKTYPMHNPHGLGIDNGTLFICDGAAGLKVFDASDPLQIAANQLAHFPGIHAYDVIPLSGLLLMIGEDGFYQYDYSDLTQLVLVSQLSVQKP